MEKNISRKVIIKPFHNQIPKDARIRPKTVYQELLKEDLANNRQEGTEWKKGFHSPKKVSAFLDGKWPNKFSQSTVADFRENVC